MIAENLYEQIFSSDETFFEGNLPAGLPAEDKTKAGKAGSSAPTLKLRRKRSGLLAKKTTMYEGKRCHTKIQGLFLISFLRPF